jgi:serpin B
VIVAHTCSRERSDTRRSNEEVEIMLMFARNALFFAAMLLVFGSCGGVPSPGARPVQGAKDVDLKPIAQNINAFTLDMFRTLRENEDPGTNTLASPYSVATALAMVYAGANGPTADKMRTALHFAANTPEFHNAIGNLGKSLVATDDYQLRVANALWPHLRYTLLDSYLELMREAYETDVTALDYIGESGEARETINAWVEKATKDRIRDLIPEGALNADTRLVLTNAIYFKGLWVSQFKKDFTADAPFTLLDDSTTEAPMMTQREDFRYMENDWIQAVDLSYAGDRIAMTILLPGNPADLARLEAELTPDWLQQTLDAMAEQEIDLSIPRFTTDAKYSLTQQLSSMGMGIAFTDDADFSGISGVPDLFISDVIHQAFIEVNEEGTEAAAATAEPMATATEAIPMEVPSFRADHPFIYLLRDRETGCILFTGVLAKPA